MNKHLNRHPDRMLGFTLLEVLVSLVILLVGLLGIAGLMVKGQRANFEAYQRQQALALAQNLAEELRANQGGAPYFVTGVTEGPNMPGTGGLYAAINDCGSTVICDRAQLAENDLASWDGLLVGTSETSGGGTMRHGGIMKARGCVEWNGDNVQPVFLVSVAWQGESDTAVPTSSACGTGLYGASDARRRVVTLTVSTCRLNSAAPWGCS